MKALDIEVCLSIATRPLFLDSDDTVESVLAQVSEVKPTQPFLLLFG